MAPLRLEYRSPAELAENPRNWRRHPEAQLSALSDVLGEVGWAGACLYNERTGRLIDGHARRKVAIEQGCESVPVLVGDWDEAQEAKILATLDPLAGMAEADAQALDALLRDVQTGSQALGDMLGKLAEDAGVIPPEATPGAGGDDFDATPEEGPTRTQPGELWLIGGKHRLLVGDCTVAANVERLMGGEKAGAVVTDPPYGIDAVGSDGRIGYAKRFGRIHGDTVPFDPRHLLDMADEVVLFGGNHFADRLPASSCWLIWDKRDATTSNDFADAELAWCKQGGVARVFRHLWSGWARASEHGVAREHPTQKPVAVMEWVIKERTGERSLVLDPFLGSGTTLIAAHRLGRVCYGCELEPRYADVILKRAEAEGLACERAQSHG